MAEKLNEADIATVYLTGSSTDKERMLAKQKLQDGDLKFICVVDLYNEGVDIKQINTILEKLLSLRHKTIGEIIEYAEQSRICIKSDAYLRFVEKNEYLYWRVSQIPYSVFEALYNYIDGRKPFSTQHKVKGLEYDNVLVILDSAGWNKYNFDYVLDASIFSTLNESKRKSFPTIKKRTEKLLYVCCTRAKENLVVYYENPSVGLLEGAENLFGKDHCINLSYRLGEDADDSL